MNSPIQRVPKLAKNTCTGQICPTRIETTTKERNASPLETLQSAFALAESSEGQTDARRDHESLSYTSAGGCV
jgi:hypothetical protein